MLALTLPFSLTPTNLTQAVVLVDRPGVHAFHDCSPPSLAPSLQLLCDSALGDLVESPTARERAYPRVRTPILIAVLDKVRNSADGWVGE